MSNLQVEWIDIRPSVNAEAEFYEIVNDFGSPLEVVREAISNAIDAHATEIWISADVREIDGNKRMVITFRDNGDGMSKDVLGQDFWGLGYSRSRDRNDAIGEKGHGTKIYLRSEHVAVRTQTSNGSYKAECDRPLAALSRRELHSPRIARIEPFMDHTGTEITIIGYLDNERSMFVQDVVTDYLKWFTQIGSVEAVFQSSKHAGFRTFLKCIDRSDFEEIVFGHRFPEDRSDISRLFEQEGTRAADLYVKRHVRKGMRLAAHPEITFDVVISVEGNEAKLLYNPMIRERRSAKSGAYRVSDRYGIWLCKDYIPIMRVNEWLSGFGTGSNAFGLLHGFVNCQEFKLTANRGDIANTDPRVIEELRIAVTEFVAQIDEELSNNGLYTLRGWQEEAKTIKQESLDFERRTKSLRKRRTAKLGARLLVEPQNESEVFGIFTTVYAIHPELFDFEPLDYDTRRGIDIIGRNKTDDQITEGEFWYIELKFSLRSPFNHAFKYLRWIICWDLDKNVGDGTEFRGIEDTDIRSLVVTKSDDGMPLYYLDNRTKARKIPVVRLREFLHQTLGLEFS